LIAHLLMMSATLTICHAGSLSAAFAGVSKAFSAQHPSVQIVDVSVGSVALARRLATGALACDGYASADGLDIELMLKPAGLADYTIRFARGRMVLAYLATDPRAAGVDAENWYQKAVAQGVVIAGAHPFLDPGGYRAHLIMDLASRFYRIPGLYNSLLEHYMAPATGALGREFSFQFTYEHSAAAAAANNPAYRYLRLPDALDLSDRSKNATYAQARVTIPGLGRAGAAASVAIPASAVTWGLTIPRTATNVEDATAFVQVLLGPAGTAALQANGPAPITPAVVGRAEAARVPKAIKGLAIE